MEKETDEQCLIALKELYEDPISRNIPGILDYYQEKITRITRSLS